MGEWIVKCGNCGADVEVKKHVNICKCGARIKILDYHGEDKK